MAQASKKKAAAKKRAAKGNPKGTDPRHRLTDRARARFIEQLRQTANVSEAARSIDFSRQRMYDIRDSDEAFALEWDGAVQEAIDALEREAWRRAVEGTDKPVTYQGEITDTFKEYSDRMLELLLRAHRPEKYKERRELSGPDGGPIQFREVQRRIVDPDGDTSDDA